MEREPLPIIANQTSLLVLAVFGHLLVHRDINLLNPDYYIILGVLIIIFGPIVSQILYGIWKMLGGFSMFDYSSEFMYGVPFTKRWIVQTTFDIFWHSHIVDGPALEYSRRRSASCQLNLFGWIISLSASISYLIELIIIRNNGVGVGRALIFFIIFLILFLVYYFHYRISSKELREVQEYYLKNHREEIQQRIHNKLGLKITNNVGEKEQPEGLAVAKPYRINKFIKFVKEANELIAFVKNLMDIDDDKKRR